jgi:hypothetical protein
MKNSNGGCHSELPVGRDARYSRGDRAGASLAGEFNLQQRHERRNDDDAD